MGNVIIHDWTTDRDRQGNMMTPLGPLVKRDGKQVITITILPKK